MRLAPDLDGRESDIDAGARDIDALFGAHVMTERSDKQRR
jgi:hypothetical protein